MDQTWNKVCAFELQFDIMRLNEMQQVHRNKGVTKLGHIGVRLTTRDCALPVPGH